MSSIIGCGCVYTFWWHMQHECGWKWFALGMTVDNYFANYEPKLKYSDNQEMILTSFDAVLCVCSTHIQGWITHYIHFDTQWPPVKSLATKVFYADCSQVYPDEDFTLHFWWELLWGFEEYGRLIPVRTGFKLTWKCKTYNQQRWYFVTMKMQICQKFNLLAHKILQADHQLSQGSVLQLVFRDTSFWQPINNAFPRPPTGDRDTSLMES